MKKKCTKRVRPKSLIRHVAAKPWGGFPFQENFWWTAAEQKRCVLISSVETWGMFNLFLSTHKEVGSANPFFLSWYTQIGETFTHCYFMSSTAIYILIIATIYSFWNLTTYPNPPV